MAFVDSVVVVGLVGLELLACLEKGPAGAEVVDLLAFLEGGPVSAEVADVMDMVELLAFLEGGPASAEVVDVMDVLVEVMETMERLQKGGVSAAFAPCWMVLR